MNLKESEKEKLRNLGFEVDKELGLNRYEITYCIEKGYIERPKDESEEREAKKGDNFYDVLLGSSTYRVFKELREHGIICRFTEDSDLIRVYQKGYRPGEDRTKYLMKVVEGEFPNKEKIKELIKISKRMRKDLVVALVEDEIFYIKIGITSLF